MFGHAVSVYYKDVFDKHATLFDELGIDANNGIGDVYAKIAELPDEQRAEIEADIQAVYEHRPALAMVDSDKGNPNRLFLAKGERKPRRNGDFPVTRALLVGEQVGWA